MESPIKILTELRLDMTCGACPEQYDVYYGDKQVGYLRLRHGNFTVQYPDASGELIYEAQPIGDGLFEDEEREYFLTMAKMAISLRVAQSDKPIERPC